MLLELVGPELQSIYDDRQIEVNDSVKCLYLIIAIDFTRYIENRIIYFYAKITSISDWNRRHALRHWPVANYANWTRSIYTPWLSAWNRDLLQQFEECLFPSKCPHMYTNLYTHTHTHKYLGISSVAGRGKSLLMQFTNYHFHSSIAFIGTYRW